MLTLRTAFPEHKLGVSGHVVGARNQAMLQKKRETVITFTNNAPTRL